MTMSLVLMSMTVLSSTSGADQCPAGPDAPDLQDRLHELCQAAREGDPGAMYSLGLAYIEGVVVDDYDKGVAWLKKASFAGNSEATKLYEFIGNAQIGPGC